MPKHPDFPFEVQHVKTGQIVIVETARQFNNLAVAGFKVKNKSEQESTPVTPEADANSGQDVSDSQPQLPVVPEVASTVSETAPGTPVPLNRPRGRK